MKSSSDVDKPLQDVYVRLLLPSQDVFTALNEVYNARDGRVDCRKARKYRKTWKIHIRSRCFFGIVCWSLRVFMESPTQVALSEYFLRTERCHCEMHRAVEKIDFSRVFPFCLSPECLNLECCLGWVFRNFVAQKPFKTNWFTSSDFRAVTVPSMRPWFLLMLTKLDFLQFL